MSRKGTQAAKAEVQNFWGAMYRSAYADLDAGLDRPTLLALLDETEAMFRERDMLAVTEMPIETLTGKRVLEIGSGAGAHSALFAHHGAQVVAIDLAFDRARATSRKLALLGDDAHGCAAVTGDAERLPFATDSFDIVYSNGVLHHSPDTAAAIAELRRVLKPGGLAVVMLYCKSSINYWVTLWLGYGLLRGGLRRGVDRLGARTEWAGGAAPATENPITRCYTRSGIETLFAEFENVGARKSEFAIVHLPKLGKLWRRVLAARGRMHRGGLLPYGAPWPVTTPLERWIGRRLGWAWNIAAVKPSR